MRPTYSFPESVVEEIAESDVVGVGFFLLLEVVVGGFGVADEE